MKPDDIKILLIRKGISQSEIARMLGVSSQMVNQMIHGKKKGHILWKEIAKILNVDVVRLLN